MGRRVRRTAQITYTDGTTQALDRVIVWDGAQEIEEFNATDGVAAARFVYGPRDVDDLLTYEPLPADPSAHTYYYYQDVQYSVAVIADETGAIAERYTYSSIYGVHQVTDRSGNPISPSGEVGNPYRFQGRHWDPESGLYYFRNRYLDPEEGRFVNRDPIGIWGDGANLGNGYAYCGGNPVNRRDPFGFDGEGGASLGDAIDGTIRDSSGNVVGWRLKPGAGLHIHISHPECHDTTVNPDEVLWTQSNVDDPYLHALDPSDETIVNNLPGVGLAWQAYLYFYEDVKVYGLQGAPYGVLRERMPGTVTALVATLQFAVGFAEEPFVPSKMPPEISRMVGPLDAAAASEKGFFGNDLFRIVDETEAELGFKVGERGGITSDHFPASRWEPTEFEGRTVYQRDDLIDPAKTDLTGETNLQKMKRGAPPLGPDGKPINLHHMLQREPGPLAELTQTFHQENYSVIHINRNKLPSGVDRRVFNAFKTRYWRSRALDFTQ